MAAINISKSVPRFSANNAGIYGPTIAPAVAPVAMMANNLNKTLLSSDYLTEVSDEDLAQEIYN